MKTYKKQNNDQNKMKFNKDMDFVEFYANKLKEDNSYFEQYRKFINNQINASRSLFSNLGKGEDFKKKARHYLKGRGLI